MIAHFLANAQSRRQWAEVRRIVAFERAFTLAISHQTQRNNLMRYVLCLCIFATTLAFGRAEAAGPEVIRPVVRGVSLPKVAWENPAWTRAALSALHAHGKALRDSAPRDVGAWCPAYVGADQNGRAAFWVGFLSALAKHESTWRADAVGGGGRWFGLLQIAPATARGYGCGARSGTALKAGPANLSCAVRIMAVTVPRDRAIAIHDGRWRGVAADWGPMTQSSKRRQMQSWLRQQPYCRSSQVLRPVPRPAAAVRPDEGDQTKPK